MRKLVTALLALTLTAAFAAVALAAGPGPFYAKGDMYCAPGCWNADAGNLLYDDGLNGDGGAADGVWGGNVTTDQALGRHEFKIANLDWSESYFFCNLWVHTSGPGDVVHFTLDGNAHGDGWWPDQNIVWSDHYAPPGTTFEVIGSAPETGSWGGGVPAALVGGIWRRVVVIAAPGYYEAKFRATGTWDVCNIGKEGAAAPCGANLDYTTVAPDSDVLFEFNPATGRARVSVLGPTPTRARSWGALKTIYR